MEVHITLASVQHMKFQNFYYRKKAVIQKYFEPLEATKLKIDQFISKIDPNLLNLVLKYSGMNNSSSRNATLSEKIKSFDDITVEAYEHLLFTNIHFIRLTLAWAVVMECI